MLKNNKVKYVLFYICSLIICLITNLSPIFKLGLENTKEVFKNSGVQIFQVAFSGSILMAVMILLCYIVGKKVHENLNIENKTLDKNGKIKVLGIVFGLLVLSGCYDTLVSSMYNVTYVNIFNSLIDSVAAVFYDSLLGQIVVSYCIISLLILTACKYKSKITDKSIDEIKDDKKFISVVSHIICVCIALSFTMIQIVYVVNWESVNVFLIFVKLLITIFLPYLYISEIYVKYGLKWSIIVSSVYKVFYVGIIPLLLSII